MLKTLEWRRQDLVEEDQENEVASVMIVSAPRTKG